MNSTLLNVSRRHFLKAGIGLTIAMVIPACARSPESASETTTIVENGISFEPNAFIRIGSDNTVTVIAKHLEMGQGTYTGLATLIAEELDADWSQIKVEGAPANAKLYNNLAWGPYQGTGGSSAIANSFDQMRQAGATARAMLVQAAASAWNVPVTEVNASNGVLSHASGKQGTYGEFAEAAIPLSIPKEVKLKDPKDYKLIGKIAPRRDSLAKTNGSALFTQDIQLENMLVAVVAHAPMFGAKVKSVNDVAAKAVKRCDACSANSKRCSSYRR